MVEPFCDYCESFNMSRAIGISRLLDMCFSGIHNANYIVNSIVWAVILVRGSRVSAYGIQPTHAPIHVLDMHGTQGPRILSVVHLAKSLAYSGPG